jgi:diguanylate cyclase (GGDEF)-like protein
MDVDRAGLLSSARASYEAGNLDAAEAAAAEALEACLARDDLSSAADAFELLGSVDRERGNYNSALERYLKSLELARSAADRAKEAVALNQIGEVLSEAGERREALGYFIQASELLNDQGGSGIPSAETGVTVMLRIGRTLLDLDESENAAGYLELALEGAERTGSRTSLARACAALAVVERRRGDHASARLLIDRALETARDGGPLTLAEIVLESAALRLDAGDHGAVLADLEEAERAAGKGGSKPKLAEIFRLRSIVHERTGSAAEALSDFKRFREIEESISGERVARLVQSAEVRGQLESARREAEIYRQRYVELKEHRNELELTNARLLAVAEIGREVASSLDSDEVAFTIYERLVSLIDVTDFSLALHEPDTDRLHFRLLIKDGERKEPFFLPVGTPGSPAAWVFAHGEPLRLDDTEKEHEHFDNMRYTPSTASIMFVPLFHDRKVIGAMGVHSPRAGVYGEEDEKLLSALAAFVAVALENSRVHEELARLNEALRAEKAELERMTKKISHIANHDGLTGLPNRLLLSELLDAAISRSTRSKKTIAVMFLDLDDFKPINDKYGHMSGDIALVVLSERIKRALRASDTVARVGGDEFVVLAADLDDPRTAATVAEKLVAACRRPIDIQGNECRVGASVGIALFPNDGLSAEELLKRSDEALYRVKRSGKNRYAFYGELRA